MALFGWMRANEHKAEVVALNDRLDTMRRTAIAAQAMADERHDAVVRAERGARIAAENEAAQLRGRITAINHAHGKPADWSPALNKPEGQ